MNEPFRFRAHQRFCPVLFVPLKKGRHIMRLMTRSTLLGERSIRWS